MTREDIKNLINGITKENTTDQLCAEVLTAIVDSLGVNDYVLGGVTKTNGYKTMTDFTDVTGLTFEDLKSLANGRYLGIKEDKPDEVTIYPLNYCHFDKTTNQGSVTIGVIGVECGCDEEWIFTEDGVSITYVEA